MRSVRLHPWVLSVCLAVPVLLGPLGLFLAPALAQKKQRPKTSAADTDEGVNPFQVPPTASANRSRTLTKNLESVTKPPDPQTAPAKTDPQGDEPALPAGTPGDPQAQAQEGPQLQMRYHGVAPGRAELPPHPPKLPLGKGPQRMTFPGFQVNEGVPTVFLQLSGPVEYSVSEKPGQVLLTLHDTVVNVRNNLRPLKVEAFRTPVQQVSIINRPNTKKTKNSENTVTVIVEVKGQVAHQERLTMAENGYSMLVMQVTSMGPATAASATPTPEPREPRTPSK